MAGGPAFAAKVAVIVAPLAGGLVFGSWLAGATRSWGAAFVLWPLLWWSVVAAIAGLLGYRIASAVAPIVSREIAAGRLERGLTVTSLAGRAGAAMLLAGLAAAIWVMVAGKTVTAPVELYWLIPAGVFAGAATRPADQELSSISRDRRRASQEEARRRRCAGLTAEQRLAFDHDVLLSVHALESAPGNRWITVSDVEAKLGNECAPELLPAALRAWAAQNLISVTDPPALLLALRVLDPSRSSDLREVRLTPLGHRICARAQKAGLNDALAEHKRCIELDDQALMDYRDELFGDIAELARKRAPVTMKELLSVHVHPCAVTLAASMLESLAELGVISVSNQEVLGLGDPPYVSLTASGRQISGRLAVLGRLEAALQEREEAARQEEERKKRCAETTFQQRIEFEDRFLQELHRLTGGDTRRVRTQEIWSRLNHECAAELTPHAVRVWRERNCVSHPERFDDELSRGFARVSLTAAGRDLCVLAEELGSMQAALKQRSGEYRVKQEFNVQNSQVGAVGSHNDVRGNEFVQNVSGTDPKLLGELAEELAALRRALNEGPDSAERGVAVGAISQAEIAARTGDRAGVTASLARAGKWVLDTAKEISLDLAAEAIAAALRAHNISL